MKIPSSLAQNMGRTCCVQKLFFDIQNNFCTQHVLPLFCKKKSFWQRFSFNKMVQNYRAFYMKLFQKLVHEWKQLTTTLNKLPWIFSFSFHESFWALLTILRSLKFEVVWQIQWFPKSQQDFPYSTNPEIIHDLYYKVRCVCVSVCLSVNTRMSKC